MAIALSRSSGSIAEPARKLTVAREVDVLVIGGGTSGCMAAIAAARAGAPVRVLLVDRYGFLGGTATAAMVGVFCGIYTCGPQSTHQLLVGGLPHEAMRRLEAVGAGFKYRHRFQLDHEVFKVVLDQWLREAGVEILFHTMAVEALIEDGAIKGVVVESKGGRQAILAGRVIDASGDGDVAALSGAPFEKGDDEGRLQAPTMVFYMGGVDVERAMAFPEAEIRRLLIEVGERGEFEFPRVSGSFSPAPQKGKVHVNMSRVVDVDGTDPWSLTAGTLEGRRQVEGFARFLIKYVPGFKAAHIDAIAPQLGVRETRRIMGEHVLTRENVLGAHKSETAICRSSWPIEDHSQGTGTIRLHLPGDDYYHVPFGCLMPLEVDNLLVTGRCVSATHDGQASVRVMGPGMAMGQAAGTAAVLSLKQGVAPRHLDIGSLQSALVVDGALI
ncbi:MAG TPA: FAD-dependent oxidoreductase [Devosiaceae bacterium]|nr:FAD-dependent oxidoreductase [Devosiaceae bacterium]